MYKMHKNFALIADCKKQSTLVLHAVEETFNDILRFLRAVSLLSTVVQDNNLKVTGCQLAFPVLRTSISPSSHF